jgi:hypothetical protein
MEYSHPARFPRILMAGTVLLLLLASGFSVWAAPKGEPRGAEPRSPKILLSASPAFGFSPLSVQLVATLRGVNPHDSNFCHAGTTWIRVDPGSSPEKGTRLTEAPRCLHDEKEVAVTTSFSKTFELYTPGPYLYQLVLQAKDGTQVRSNFVKVQVIRVP